MTWHGWLSLIVEVIGAACAFAGIAWGTQALGMWICRRYQWWACRREMRRYRGVRLTELHRMGDRRRRFELDCAASAQDKRERRLH